MAMNKRKGGFWLKVAAVSGAVYLGFRYVEKKGPAGGLAGKVTGKHG
jgi:hypothetical protein